MKEKNKLDDGEDTTPVAVHGKYFVRAQKWVHDGTWYVVIFAEKKSWMSDSDSVISFRDKKKAEATAKKLNALIGW
jgi:hypothetical protein